MMSSTAQYLLPALPATAAVVSAFMWLDYFRRIDVFEKERSLPLVLALLIGCATPFISLHVYDLLDNVGVRENGRFMNDLFFAVFAIGLNEETCKMLGVLVVFRVFRKQINEPVDYLVYAGTTALGFSMVENYVYFINHGVKIITSRAFYSALEHIINTSIIVYGLYRHKLFNKGIPAVNAFAGIVIAVASHGLFDFFLRDSLLGYFTSFLSMFIYLVGINFWIQMLNNANNYSRFFDYDKVPLSAKLAYRLILWYLLTLVIAFVYNALIVGPRFSVLALLTGILSDGFLFLIVILRISRFRILQSNYLRVTLGFPFYITRNNDEDFRIPLFNIPLKIRGENFREHLLTRFLNRQVELHPVNPAKSVIKKSTSVIVEGKHFLFDDVIVYSISLHLDAEPPERRYILKPDLSKQAGYNGKYPVFALYCIDLVSKNEDLSVHNYKELRFLEYVHVEAQGQF